MINIDKELDRYLSLLRNKIRESGFIQMEIQERLGWGRSLSGVARQDVAASFSACPRASPSFHGARDTLVPA